MHCVPPIGHTRIFPPMFRKQHGDTFNAGKFLTRSTVEKVERTTKKQLNVSKHVYRGYKPQPTLVAIAARREGSIQGEIRRHPGFD